LLLTIPDVVKTPPPPKKKKTSVIPSVTTLAEHFRVEEYERFKGTRSIVRRVEFVRMQWTGIHFGYGENKCRAIFEEVATSKTG
jgi:hypothetical protein